MTASEPQLSQSMNSGDASGGGAPVAQSGVDAGASGSNSGAMGLPTGGLIAIVVIVVAVCLIGATTTTLYFLTKKREWKLRERVRKSARRVASVLTPRRAQFPSSARRPANSSFNSRSKPTDKRPTSSHNRLDDLEKGKTWVQVRDKAGEPGL
ncbi:hypothetical protein GQ602_001198 [Ophiocordyceps camponoti-floridani]|uniref:Uncharacterized protein n=1 Tax=Ophiocordyceps camponoti-floridani TaxID=2030778 RepID=A0A8H4QDL7_9HYPO|nr:hypothetical protein GQ602_001198 [Ophiocordyceps camponoti-floridani]